MSLLGDTDSGADFSPCRRFRYRLWRAWSASKPTLNLVGCNPSKAGEIKNDATATKVVGLAHSLGFGRLVITNCFAFVATEPQEMREAWKRGSEIIGPENDRWLMLAVKEASMIVCAWGLNAHIDGRPGVVENMLRRGEISRFQRQLFALKLCKDGTPQHPLYLRNDSRPFEWKRS